MSQSLGQKAFKLTFETYYPAIRNFVYYKTGDMDLAEDLAQETFVKLWEKSSEVKMETVKSYLYTIANNLALNHFKHQKVVLNFQHQTLKEGAELSNSPQYQLELKEFDQRLQRAIEELPEKVKVTFLMNRVDKMKYKEIAEALDMSVKGVQKRIKKALELLNEKLQYRL